MHVKVVQDELILSLKPGAFLDRLQGIDLPGAFHQGTAEMSPTDKLSNLSKFLHSAWMCLESIRQISQFLNGKES